MANQHRGEVEIKLGGKAYTLRLNHEGISAAEDKAGLGVIGMSFRVFDRRHGFREIAALIYGGLIGAGNRDLTFEQVRDLIVAEGVMTYHVQALVLMKNALNGLGTEDEEGKKEEPKADPQIQT